LASEAEGGRGVIMDELKVPCEIFSRIVGYLRPVQNWNESKQQEFEDRKIYRIPEKPSEMGQICEVEGKAIV